ncbi:P-loop containing nucleoside triphosphate hydrolase protein [Rhizoclosmatium globosum]|uniref:p-loop containing nucleoside triphosphate hydrolase protein n=1 Tax=Rhizoclosmatium globosum TaxID=329046 RepID=A0A1Y2CFQ6_9FUNG|nr:P-loop containing nucleoside triphosphate hydrolase protein [Rhizoclosmatium globosum]|eukprot:ORY45756.1 P-loop containing nucleoside triphosphate hydrolase protein [Rhizoclosmatium globosum]
MSCSSAFTVWDASGATDFSQCFEESVLSVVSAVAGILFAIFRLTYLRHKKVIEPRLIKWHITANRITSVLSIVASLVALIVVTISSFSSGSVTISVAFNFAASVGTSASLYVEHTRLARASTGLMLYWLLSVVIWVIRIRTRFVLGQTDALVYVFMVQAVLNALSFIFENMTFVEDFETGQRVLPTPLGSNINVFSRVTYWYMQPLLKKGAKKELTIDDLWKPDPHIGYILPLHLLNAILNVFMGMQQFISSLSVGYQIRSALCTAIFRKSLHLTNTSRQATSTGHQQHACGGYTTHHVYQTPQVVWMGFLVPQKVTNSRQEELKSIKAIGILKSLESLVGSVTPLFVSLASFAVYSAINTAPEQALNASRIFVSLSLFNILGEPIMYLGFIFSGGSACYISLNRIQEFLLLEELDESNWDAAAEESTLSNINTTISQGSLTAVIGRVGTGKSSSYQCFLSQAWIENATIRDNILFGSEYDEKKYKAVIDACALHRDLTCWYLGLTEIGEKGVNLSGGQKQRLSLARAVYNDAEIYLLDDVLSAVDAHVDKHIFDNVIGPLEYSVAKLDKTIEQQGSYQELIDQDGAFKVLIEEFARDIEDAGKGLAKVSDFIKYLRAAGMSWVILAFTLLLLLKLLLLELVFGSPTGPLAVEFIQMLTISEFMDCWSFLLQSYLVYYLTMYVKVGQNAAREFHSKIIPTALSEIFKSLRELGGNLCVFFTRIAQCTATVIVICSVTPYFMAIILPLLQFITTCKTTTSRLLKQYSAFHHVKAFGKTGEYIEKNNELQDAMQSTFLTQMGAGRWIQFRLEILGVFISFGAAIFAVVQRNSISAGSAGLSIGYALQITQYLYQAMRMFGNFQNNGVSLERIFEYFDLPSEAPQRTALDEGVELTGWPREGRIAFKDLKMRYRQGTPLVLNGISMDVKGGEKVGIVGRTGAGKSSLSVALFRLSEADEGSIEIDGVDVSKLGLNLLRTKLTIIPQEAVLFGASVRDNIDPGHLYTDEQIWSALEASHLKTRFAGHEEGLEQKIKFGGENMSIGERQLFCLARAILRKTKILLLDEATAGIDLETDSLIQATIRREFADSTVLTNAHRIQTIMDSDKIIVLNEGRVEEMQTPTELMKSPDSAFAQLAAAAGVKETL